MKDLNIVKGSFLEIDGDLRAMLGIVAEHAQRTWHHSSAGLEDEIINFEMKNGASWDDAFQQANECYADLNKLVRQLMGADIPDAVLTIHLPGFLGQS